MRIFVSVESQTGSTFPFCTLLFYKDENLSSLLAPLWGGGRDRHMRLRTFLYEIQFWTTFISIHQLGSSVCLHKSEHILFSIHLAPYHCILCCFVLGSYSNIPRFVACNDMIEALYLQTIDGKCWRNISSICQKDSLAWV